MNALILVDIQNDFLPGGSLAVPNGDEVIPVANKLVELKHEVFDVVVASQDWHPPEHICFASNHDDKEVFDVIDNAGDEQVLWPDHCIQGSEGAEFSAELNMNPVDAVIRKGTNPHVDSYSAFFDNHKISNTGLTGYLREQAIERVFVMGLATDYCVQFTALHAAERFETVLVIDGCRGIDGDGVEEALVNMRKAGVEIMESEDIVPAM